MTVHRTSLPAQVALRIALVAAFCFAAATLWVVRDTAAELRDDAAGSAQRVADLLGSRTTYIGLMSLSIGGVAPTPVFFDWQDYPAPFLVAPGVCVEFGQIAETMRRRCGPWDAEAAGPPDWFRALFARLLDLSRPPSVEIVYRGVSYGTVTAHLDPEAAYGRAWSRVRVLLGVALAMTVATGTLTVMVVGRTLAPFREIVSGLRALEKGDFALRLPAFRVREFGQLARAYNDMAEALARGRAERAALTRRLFEVQESERRMIARELHDEFGQCLTATRALAAAIERRAPTSANDLAGDARSISEISAGMMESLKSALFRLRPPELDQLGLEQALARLVGGWTARAPETRFVLTVRGECGQISDEAALSLYRIAQECLTNAIRHGRPSLVTLELDAPATGPATLVVSDDGGVPEDGDRFVWDVAAGPDGFGLLGIRERVAALDGTLSLGRTELGMKVAAILPQARDQAPRHAAPGSGSLPGPRRESFSGGLRSRPLA